MSQLPALASRPGQWRSAKEPLSGGSGKAFSEEINEINFAVGAYL